MTQQPLRANIVRETPVFYPIPNGVTWDELLTEVPKEMVEGLQLQDAVEIYETLNSYVERGYRFAMFEFKPYDQSDNAKQDSPLKRFVRAVAYTELITQGKFPMQLTKPLVKVVIFKNERSEDAAPDVFHPCGACGKIDPDCPVWQLSQILRRKAG